MENRTRFKKRVFQRLGVSLPEIPRGSPEDLRRGEVVLSHAISLLPKKRESVVLIDGQFVLVVE